MSDLDEFAAHGFVTELHGDQVLLLLEPEPHLLQVLQTVLLIQHSWYILCVFDHLTLHTTLISMFYPSVHR